MKTQPHLVPRLKMSGFISLLLLYAIMVWTGTTLLLSFTKTTLHILVALSCWFSNIRLYVLGGNFYLMPNHGESHDISHV